MRCAVNAILRELRKVGSLAQRKVLMRFFKTGKGQYGEGDKFLALPSKVWIARSAPS